MTTTIMTQAEWYFKRACQAALINRQIPTPKWLHAKGYGNGRNLNGLQTQWRTEVLLAFRCVKFKNRWRQPGQPDEWPFVPSPLPAPSWDEVVAT